MTIGFWNAPMSRSVVVAGQFSFFHAGDADKPDHAFRILKNQAGADGVSDGSHEPAIGFRHCALRWRVGLSRRGLSSCASVGYGRAARSGDVTGNHQECDRRNNQHLFAHVSSILAANWQQTIGCRLLVLIPNIDLSEAEDLLHGEFKYIGPSLRSG